MIKVLSAFVLLTSFIGFSFANTTTTNATVTYNDDGTISINMFVSGVDPMEDAPTTTVNTVVAPQVVELPSATSATSQPAPAIASASVCTASGSTLDLAISQFAQQCPNVARDDCDPVNGEWVCSSAQIGDASPLGSGSIASLPTPTARSVNTIAPGSTSAPSTSLIAQIEQGSIWNQGLWAVTTSGLRWTGPNRFDLAQRRDDGNVLLQVTVQDAGNYRLTTRGRIVSGIQEEPPNDMWVTFGNLDWTKAFIPKNTVGFSTNIIGEGRVLESFLPAGTTSITVSGRSTGFEIDYVGLERISGSTAGTNTVVATASNTNASANIPANVPTPRPNWVDSYSTGGQCYCASTFDHGIGSQQINTLQGVKSVAEVCRVIGEGPGIANNPVYNDIQCGHGPSNGLSDEELCPGRIDQGRAGCSVIGPTWNLNQHFPNKG